MSQEDNNFRTELINLINKHNMEANSDTPDFILADFILGCLKSFDISTNRRYEWYSLPNVMLKKAVKEGKI